MKTLYIQNNTGKNHDAVDDEGDDEKIVDEQGVNPVDPSAELLHKGHVAFIWSHSSMQVA